MATSALQAHIQGLREAKAAFTALPLVMRTHLNDATETTLSEIKRHAQGRIQASPSIRTRALLNSIAFKLNKNNGRGRVGVTSGPQLKYAHFVEFGTVKMRAEPYMIPAAQSQERPFLERCLRKGKDVEKDLAAIGLRNL